MDFAEHAVSGRATPLQSWNPLQAGRTREPSGVPALESRSLPSSAGVLDVPAPALPRAAKSLGDQALAVGRSVRGRPGGQADVRWCAPTGRGESGFAASAGARSEWLAGAAAEVERRGGARRTAQRCSRFFVVSCAFLVLSACGRSADPQATTQPPAVKACPAGYSVDPPRGALEPGIRAFRDRRYGEAQREFSALAAQFPESATARLWLADSVLFDRELDSRVAAERSLPIYEAVGTLHAAGCKLPRRPRYYHLMDAAYAHLRLASLAPEGDPPSAPSPEVGGAAALAYEPGHVHRALEFLALATAEFPTSAEVPYTEARARCALSQSTHAESEIAAALTACQHKFADALRLAGQLQRPRFLRTHRSMQDWIVRSRTQSEFGPLRATPEYTRIVQEALESSPLPIALTPGDLQ